MRSVDKIKRREEQASIKGRSQEEWQGKKDVLSAGVTWENEDVVVLYRSGLGRFELGLGYRSVDVKV